MESYSDSLSLANITSLIINTGDIINIINQFFNMLVMLSTYVNQNEGEYNFLFDLLESY